MPNLTKRTKLIKEQVDLTKVYDLSEAFKLLQEIPKPKFDESVELVVKLGVDSRKSDQVVRGAVVLPSGSGKTVRVAVFAQGDQAEKAKAAGADVVGMEELVESIKAGKLDFETVIATPDAMALVGKVGQILGPRGLMPNPKVGTVTADVATAVKNAKSGQAKFRTDKGGIIHSSIGKLSFTIEQLKENLQAVLAELKKLKPTSSKGMYIKKVVISSTMGPGITVDQASI